MQAQNRNFETFATVAIDTKRFLDVQSMPLVQVALKRAVNDLCLYSFGQTNFKSSLVQVSQSLVSELPKDCVRVTKLGIWRGHGLSPLILDRKLSITTKANYDRELAERAAIVNPCPSCCPITTETGLILPSETDNSALYCDACTFFSPNFSRQGRLYGHRTNYNGGWIDDRNNNRVILEDVKADTILVAEYQSSMTDQQKSLLPIAAFDVLMNKAGTYVFNRDRALLKSYENSFKEAKQRFDSQNIQATFSIEEVISALSSPRSGLSRRNASVHQGLWL